MPCATRYASGQEETKPAAADGNILETEEQIAEVSVATGTIFSLEADSISLTPEKSKIPLVFEITSATPLVDELDKKVAKDLVLTGIGATVQYVTVGEKHIASKIIVTRKNLAGSGPQDPTAANRKRAELTETKVIKDEEARSKALAVEGGGTLMGFEQIIAVRATGEAALTQYTVTSATLFVDSAGNPVPPHVVRTGVGLKVQYVDDAGRKLATRVTVQSMPAWVREGMMAAESGTSVRVPSAPAGTVSSNQTTTGSMADSFLYPPVLSLRDVNPNVPPGIKEPKAPDRANTKNAPSQPNANDKPNNDQPDANNRPNSTPGRSTSPGRNSSSGAPSQPSTPPAAPGAR